MNMRCSILKLIKFNINTDISVRFYARWAHRRPIRVLSPEGTEIPVPKPEILEKSPSEEEISKKHENHFQKSVFNHPKSKSKIIDMKQIDLDTNFEVKPVKKPEKVKYTKSEVMNTTFDANGDYVYTKMKDNDSKIGNLMLMVKSRKLRDRKSLILLEGKRLIKDAILAKCSLEYILFSRKTDLDYIKDLLPKKDVRLYKMAYRDMQMWSDLTTSPGIMGIFKTPTHENITPSQNILPLTIICDNIREPGNLGAILRSSVAVGAEKIILTKGCVDLWETKVLRSSAGAHFRLPIYKDQTWAELKPQLPENPSIYLADNNIITSTPDSRLDLHNLCLKVPVLPYYSVNFGSSSIVLVIGGETEGLSEESFVFAYENKGVRLNIPLSNEIESLNTGTALGIIVFEIKRQLLMKK